MRLPLARDLPPVPVPVAEDPVVIGYVVVMRGISKTRLWLTCAEVMDLETAEHEAATWRRSAAGSGFRYDVCAVTGGER